MKCASVLGLVISLTMGHSALAQTVDTRPATPTVAGDTGLWFVPSAEVLPAGRWSFGAARTESDFSQGFTDVEQWPITFGAGLGRAELFGSLSVVTRIDRDTEPLFNQNPDFGGIVNEFPSTRSAWSGNKLGDLIVGGKFALMSERRQQPLALAVRTFVKIPTASDEDGVGTGKADYFLDGVVGREIARSVDLTGYTGFVWRGNPDNVSLSDGIRWGVGASVPSRSRLRLNTEFYGEFFSDDDVVAAPGAVTAEDGTTAPNLSVLDNPKSFSLSVTWQGRGGGFIDAGMVYAFGVDRNDFVTDASVEGSDSLGFQVRIGWHRGVGVYVPPPPPVALAAPPPPPAPAPAPPAPPPNQLPTLTAQCDPCEVEAGRSVSLVANGRDLDGDPLRYNWSAPSGAVSDPASAASQYTAPDSPGVQTLTVTVDDGRGGTATQNVRVTVRERPVATSGLDVAFDDVHFDFDEFTLKAEATASLDRVVQAMTATPAMRIQVDGHTDSIGTETYNEELSQKRAETVREYLISKGIAADRIALTGYGETRPVRGNDTANDRAVNRRAVVTVRATAR